MKIAVLAGGRSPERSVSILSGKNVAEALVRSGHEVKIVDPAGKLLENAKLASEAKNGSETAFLSGNCAGKRLSEAKIELDAVFELFGVDRVFNVLHGGSGEDGRMLALLEVLGIPHNGSSPAACAVAMDKILAKRLMSESGVLTPPYTVYKKGESITLPPRYPCVVKPVNGGSSLGVTFVFRPFELERAVKEAEKYCDEVLIEAAVFGRELSVGVLRDKALAVTEIKPVSGFYDYDSKYTPQKSEEITPAPLSNDLTVKAKAMAEAAHRLLGMKNFSRVDMILEEATGLLYCLEVNAFPGMTSTSLLPQGAAAVGIGFDELCVAMLD